MQVTQQLAAAASAAQDQEREAREARSASLAVVASMAPALSQLERQQVRAEGLSDWDSVLWAIQ